MKYKLLVVLLILFSVANTKESVENEYIYIKYFYFDGYGISYLITHDDNKANYFNKFSMPVLELYFNKNDFDKIQDHVLNYNFKDKIENNRVEPYRSTLYLKVFRNDSLILSENSDYNYINTRFFKDFNEMLKQNNIYNENLNYFFDKHARRSDRK